MIGVEQENIDFPFKCTDEATTLFKQRKNKQTNKNHFNKQLKGGWFSGKATEFCCGLFIF